MNKRVVTFTNEPGLIDRSVELEYDFKLVGGVEVYSVYPASQDDPAA